MSIVINFNGVTVPDVNSTLRELRDLAQKEKYEYDQKFLPIYQIVYNLYSSIDLHLSEPYFGKKYIINDNNEDAFDKIIIYKKEQKPILGGLFSKDINKLLISFEYDNMRINEPRVVLYHVDLNGSTEDLKEFIIYTQTIIDTNIINKKGNIDLLKAQKEMIDF